MQQKNTLRDFSKHPNHSIAFALDQQIIENGVLHSTRVTSLVSLHLLTVSKWMSRKSRCLAANPAIVSFLLSFRSAWRKSFLEEEVVLPLSQNVFPRLGREKTVAKKRNAAMRSPFAKDIEGKGVDRDDGKKERRRTVTPNISELTLNH